MKLSRRHLIIFSLSFFCLSVGTLNYLLFNPHIILFDWLKLTFKPLYIPNHLLRIIIKGYVSDLFWCASLCLTTYNLFELKLISNGNKLMLLSLPLVFEFLQYPKLIAGEFDWKDIALYIIVIAFFNTFFTTFKKRKYEKV